MSQFELRVTNPVREAQLAIWEVLKAQNELDRKLEFMPDSLDKSRFLKTRALIRTSEEKVLFKLWKRLADSLGLDERQLASGAPVVNPAILTLAQGVTRYAGDAEKMEKELTLKVIEKSEPLQTGLSGFFDFFKSEEKPPTPEETLAKGRWALEVYHNHVKDYPDYPYHSVDELATYYIPKDPKILYDGIGTAIFASREFLTDDKVAQAMAAISDAGKGLIPKNYTVFFSRLGEIASNPSILSSIPFVLKTSAVQAAEGLEELGKSTAASLQSLNFLWKYLPWVALAGGGLYLFTVLPKRGK